tara:strand:- start:28016 stop:28327 length:312 start_codon:yes stop_codon:yes gene_type:complete
MMSFFYGFGKKSWAELALILTQYGYDARRMKSIFVKSGDSYTLNTSMNNISTCPDEQFAIACVLAALGNAALATELCTCPERFVEPGFSEQNSMMLNASLRKK